MSQFAKKNATERKAKEDKDSTKQKKQKVQDAARKQNFNTKESKEKVDERELRRMLKDSETTVEQLTRHNTDLLLEKEKHQIEMQKLQEENTKFSQSEEIKNLKEELEKIKALFTQKESETTGLKEEISNLQRSMSRSSSASIVSVRGVGSASTVRSMSPESSPSYLSVRGVGSASTVKREDTDLSLETQKHQLELQKLQAENTKYDQSDEENKILKKETTDEVRGLEDDSHQQDRQEAETTPEAIKQPDEIQPELSLIRKDQHVQKMREKFTELEREHKLQDHKAQEGEGTDFKNRGKNKEDRKEDTEGSNDRSKLNESKRDPKLSQVRNEEEEEKKRILKAEHCAENLHKEAGTEDKYKQKLEELEVRVKELTEENSKLLNRLSQVRNEEEEEKKRILKAEHCAENLHKEAGTEDKYKQKLEELEVRVKELTEENSKLLNRPYQVRNEEDEEDRKRILKAEPRTDNFLKESGTKDKSKHKIEELEVRVKELTEEKNKLLNRLSEIGAIKMIDNNPNITDLSDANRPTKLAEQFFELYDNEWTDAYEHLTKTQGKMLKQSVKLLLQILKEAYDICLSSTKERVITLRKAMLSYAGLSDEDSSELELQEIEKKMWEYRTKKSQCNVIRVEEEVKQKFRNRPEQFQTDLSNTLTSYIDGCVRICWFMCIKNPPMHLDFGESEESTTTNDSKPGISNFENSKFISYTKSGDYVKYVVWPAVFLHERGPIIRKGVAQGYHACRRKEMTNQM